jgi:hypothetical protein
MEGGLISLSIEKTNQATLPWGGVGGGLFFFPFLTLTFCPFVCIISRMTITEFEHISLSLRPLLQSIGQQFFADGTR